MTEKRSRAQPSRASPADQFPAEVISLLAAAPRIGAVIRKALRKYLDVA